MSRPLRVLLISDFYPPVAGGLENHVDALAAGLAARGDEVCVATLTADPTPSAPGVVVRPLATLARLLPHEQADRPFHPPLPEPVTRHRLRQVIADFEPDVIHGHSWLTVSLPRRLGVPVLFTAHDYALVCQLRTLLRNDGTLCSGPPGVRACVECGSHTYGRAKSELLARGTIAGRRRFPADRVLAVSAAVRNALVPLVDVPIEVVPNFVQAEPALEPLSTAIPDGPFVMYAGDPGPHKGVPDLLEVWRHDRPDLPLVLATPRPVDAPLPDGVVPVSLTRGQVAAAWRRAAVAVAPSRWADPCPTVVLEAMRAGTPVVGTRVGGIPGLVRDGTDGVLVAPHDPRALATAITSLLDDRELAARLGANGAQRAREFGADVIVERIRAQYETLLASSTAA